MERDSHQVLGIAWYRRREDWERLKEIADDSDSMDETFSDWLISATKLFNALRAEGADVRQVDIDIDELARWCDQNSEPNTSASRSTFAGLKVREMNVNGRP